MSAITITPDQIDLIPGTIVPTDLNGINRGGRPVQPDARRRLDRERLREELFII